MMKISVCLETILPEIDFYDRIQIVSELGFGAVEFWGLENRDISKISNLSSKYNIPVAICCAKNVRDIRMNFASSVVVNNFIESVGIIREMGCSSMIVLAGEIEGRVDSQKNILIENLKRISEIAVKENVTVNIEPLNSIIDHKGYYLDSSTVGFEIIKSVGCNNVKLLYDIYHMQIMEGNIIDNITRNIDLTGHIHAAGVPGRNEPFRGENNYKFIFDAIEKAGYKGFFGLEYFPTYDNRQSLADVRKYFET
jgi:hydroxypyruvate isomerase